MKNQKTNTGLNRPKVWQVHKTDRNLEPARKFGDVQVLLTNPTGDYTQDVNTLRSRLERSVHPDDYLNLVGHPLFVAVAYDTIKSLFGDPVKTLCWNKHTLDYEVVAV